MAAVRRAIRLGTSLVAAAVLLAACARDAGTPAVQTAATDTATPSAPAPAPDPLAGVAAAIAPDGNYRVVPVANPGGISGRIRVDHMPTMHDTTLSGDDATACGTQILDPSVVTNGLYIQGALVWVADVHGGQALPRLRRADLRIIHCEFEPRMLALAQGTTINLQSLDAMVHHTHFYSESTDSLLSRMLTVDRWAVVPSARIAAEPGFVRVRLNQHPFIRGFVAVFQHPYFAVTTRDGRYRISGLLAGTYHVRVWHERGGKPIDRVVTVKPGLQVEFDTTLVLH